MITFVFPAPEDSGRGPVVLVFVLERENMARMTKGDPFDMWVKRMARASDQAAAALNFRRAVDLDIVVACEDPEGIKTVGELVAQRDMAGVMKFLERGRTLYAGEPSDPVKLT